MPKYSNVGIEAFSGRKSELTQQLAEAGRELRAAQRKLKPKKPNQRLLNKAVELARTAKGDLTVARSWLSQHGIINDSVMTAALDKVTAKLDAAAEGQPEAAATVVPKDRADRRSWTETFLAEHKLHTWVEEQNVQKGLLPTSTDVWKQRVALEGVHVSSSTKLKHRYQWLRRFRSKWNVSLGQLGYREKLDDKDMQAKVGLYPISSRRALYLGLPDIQTWVHKCAQKWVHIVTPFLGPQTEFCV